MESRMKKLEDLPIREHGKYKFSVLTTEELNYLVAIPEEWKADTRSIELFKKAELR